jgi:hypothetical protein
MPEENSVGRSFIGTKLLHFSDARTPPPLYLQGA